MEQDIEQITPEVTREWLHNRQIVIFAIKGTDPGAVKRYASTIIETAQKWPRDRLLLTLYDFTQSDLIPRTRQAARDVADAIPTELQGRAAFVIPRSVLGTFMLLFAKGNLRPERTPRERRFFFSRDEAIAWLREVLE